MLIRELEEMLAKITGMMPSAYNRMQVHRVNTLVYFAFGNITLAMEKNIETFVLSRRVLMALIQPAQLWLACKSWS